MPEHNDLPTDEQVYDHIIGIAKEMGIPESHQKDIEWLFENVSENNRHQHPRHKEIIYWLKVAVARKL